MRKPDRILLKTVSVKIKLFVACLEQALTNKFRTVICPTGENGCFTFWDIVPCKDGRLLSSCNSAL
jgi:hypothetical protein